MKMKRKKKCTIVDMDINEVSLVDVPANPGAVVTMRKNMDNVDSKNTEEVMSEKTKEVEKKDEQVVDVSKVELEKANATIEKLNKILALSDFEKKYYDSLQDSKKDEFISKSNKEREAVIQKSMKEDEVFDYEGISISKSEAGASTFMLLKKLAEDKLESEKKLENEIIKREASEYIQKAQDQFPNIAGEAMEKGLALRYIEKNIEDEAVKKYILDTFKFANECGNRVLKENVHGKETTFESKNAQEKLNKLAEEYATKQGIDFHKAYAHISLKTPEGKELFKETLKY